VSDNLTESKTNILARLNAVVTTTLVSVRYPLNTDSRRTIQRGLDHVADEDGSLIILHVTLLQNGDRLTRQALQNAVEAEFGEIPAHYIVRQGYVLEEAIIDEAARQTADRVIVGKTKRGRIRRRLGQLFGLYPDLEAELTQNLSTTLEVVE
jgi:nucleotide-binding universal stress UspA family protein